MVDLETILKSITFIGLISSSYYLGTKILYRWEKNQNIVNGGYAELCKHPRSKFWHKFYGLGKPSEVILKYLKYEQEQIKS